MALTPKSSWPWVRTLLHSVFDQPDSESVAAQHDRIIDALADKLPKVAGNASKSDEWAESRRYLGLDVLSKSRADHDPATEQEATPAALTA
jgi:transposase-like protein